MGLLLSIQGLSKAFESRNLFQDLSFGIESTERIGLIGPNGAGKSSLVKILAGKLSSDSGELIYQKGTRVAYLEQTSEFRPGLRVFEALLERVGLRLDDHENMNWDLYQRAEELLWQFEFEENGIQRDDLVTQLSGGWQKKLALAREVLTEPHLFLMDEPTNHLDVESILWLEDFVSKGKFASLIITHDRLFLERVSNRILELDRRNRGGLLSVSGNYSKYLETKDALMTAQENREAILRGNLRRETEWMRAGAKARTTKQQARIHRHGELSEEVKEISGRNQKKTLNIDFQSAQNAPKRLVEAKHLTKSLGGKLLFKDFEILLSPGVRIGILGANGCGKSTLVRTLLGLERPDAGKLKHSDLLKVSYFAQNREQLDPNLSLIKTVCPYGDHVTYQGRSIFVRSYLERFLFRQDQMELPVSKLSGGEQSRILMAQLMLQEANLLVLDEPTNDLDIPTLNILQDCLTEFEGAILLISHDRYFVDQVSTQILAFPVQEEDREAGRLHFFADLFQWENWHEEQDQKTKKGSTSTANNAAEGSAKRSVSATIKKELDAIAKKIERLENTHRQLEEECALPETLSNFSKLAELGAEMKRLQLEIGLLYGKWEELELNL